MRTRIVAFVALALAATLALAVRAADEPAASATTRVVKFVAAKEGTALRKPAMLLCVTPKFGGPQLEIAIPNADPAAAKADPDPALMAVVKSAKAGDYLKVTYSKQMNALVLSQVENYTPKAGELDPEAYEFVKTTEVAVGAQNCQAAIFRKADKDQTLLVPVVKNEAGVGSPNAEILAQVQKLTAGELLDIQTSQSGGQFYLKSLRPYQPAKSATFVKSATEKAESGPPLCVVTLKSGDQTVTLYVAQSTPGGPADPVVMSKVRGLAANDPVLYKSTESDGKLWLTEIKANRPAGGGGAMSGPATLTGTFFWTGKPKQITALKVVLTPVSPGEWKAVYTFTWGSPMTYTGTIKGNLRNGEVSGTGTGDGKRTFCFEGTAQNGVISFDHFETTGNKRAATGKGTMQL